ncbi:urea transporter [Caballeronia sp. TF1N1]|uniref:urea transporter n=1 Tax=Caballeronia sp. TF1N1 TaxID=2878153 RepID=UPI001FD04A70|nr:urea transporter [Caballeronia sp. TF1N1]
MSAAIQTNASFGDQITSFARSTGQIVLQRNAATGVCIFVALLCANPRLACGLLIGALTGNVITVITQDADSPAMRDDLYGFNGALAALAAFTFIGDASQAAAVAIVAAMVATLIAPTLAGKLMRFGLPIFSSPAIIVTWCWLPFLAGRGDTGAIPPVATGFVSMLQAAFAGLAPIVFATGALAGALIAIGLFAAGPSRAAWALAGSGLGAFLHALGGASDAVALSGACGFNAALAALAAAPLGGRYALLAIVASVLFERVIDCLGVAALTAPFVLASWTVLCMARRLEAHTDKSHRMQAAPALVDKGDSHVVHPHA